MRDHNLALCHAAVETLELPGPVVEFGSYQVEGQEGYADLRSLFRDREFLGCDMRPGPGVDRVEDVTDIRMGSESVGTVFCIETFEHVFQVWKAFDEVFRVLKPGGVFLLTSPFHFKIHGYPDDYWRMTPSCLRRMTEPYAARLVGGQGPEKTPHTVMCVGVKPPAPEDVQLRFDRFRQEFAGRLAAIEGRRSPLEKVAQEVSLWYRSKGERRYVREYNRVGWECLIARDAFTLTDDLADDLAAA